MFTAILMFIPIASIYTQVAPPLKLCLYLCWKKY